MALNTLPNAGLTNRGYPSDRLVTPIIINGDMSIAQRGTSFSFSSSSGFTVDRFDFERTSGGFVLCFMHFTTSTIVYQCVVKAPERDWIC